MKNIRVFFFLSENFQFLVVKFSVYLNRRVFVMVSWSHQAKACLQAYAKNESTYHTHIRADQKLHCPLTESLATTECMNGEQMSGWYFAHVQDYLNLCILRMFEGSFSLDMARNLIGNIMVTCGSKIAKLIPFVNQRWPPWLAAWNSISNLFSRTERPVDFYITGSI